MADVKEAVKRFLEVPRGSGSGYGSGSGSGYGYGSGDGDGYGSGDGYGYGYGYGDGYGYGYGDGDGDGSGYGDGIAFVCGKRVFMIDGVPTILHSVHGNVASGAILQADLTLSKCYCVKGSGYFAHGVTIQGAMQALQGKIFSDLDNGEKFERFIESFLPGKKYLARDFYNWHHILTGSCEMGRDEFAKAHGIDLDKDELTPEEFGDLVKQAYGGDIIRSLMEEYVQHYAQNQEV